MASNCEVFYTAIEPQTKLIKPIKPKYETFGQSNKNARLNDIFSASPSVSWMIRTGIFRRLLHRLKVTRVISFNRPEGIELKLFIGHRVIGWLLPGKKERHIRRPFRVFVDEGFLSRAESIHTMSPEKEE